MSEKVRIDKWLWSVRIFKTRTLASDSCREGKVKINGENVKPSYNVQLNDIYTVKKGFFVFTYQLVAIIANRVGAPIAVTCYIDKTPVEELQKYDTWFNARKGTEFREKGLGRPTKKERRVIDKFKVK
jgi:ribosome-associated heat shock protein Hsp15